MQMAVEEFSWKELRFHSFPQAVQYRYRYFANLQRQELLRTLVGGTRVSMAWPLEHHGMLGSVGIAKPQGHTSACTRRMPFVKTLSENWTSSRGLPPASFAVVKTRIALPAVESAAE